MAQMKLHVELIKFVLENAETRMFGSEWSRIPIHLDYEPGVVHYHVWLCEQAGYLAPPPSSDPTFVAGFVPNRMGLITLAGHRELERLRAAGS